MSKRLTGQSWRGKLGITTDKSASHFIAPEILAQQQIRQALEPLTTTALLCGDPLPGFSALDKQNANK